MVTKEQFEEYVKVQYKGLYNMITDWEEAIKGTSLNKDQWFYIIKNYNELADVIYPEVLEKYE